MAPADRKKTGTTITWLPDLEVFTDIDIPVDYYTDVMKRQAVVNAGVTFRFKEETTPGKFTTTDFQYENGILTTSPSWRGRTPSPSQYSGRPSGRAGTGRTSRSIR